MATINIKASTVNIPEKRAAEICGLLGEFGVEFSFIPTRNPNPERNELLKDAVTSVRALRLMKAACESENLDWNTMTIKDFHNTFSLSDLVKIRNCGKKSIEEIQNMLYKYGYFLR